MRHLKLVTASFVVVAVSAISVAAVRPALLFPQEMPKPTEQHKMLMKSVGTWEGTLTMSMPGMPTEGEVMATVVSLSGGALVANFISVALLIGETMRRTR